MSSELEVLAAFKSNAEQLFRDGDAEARPCQTNKSAA